MLCQICNQPLNSERISALMFLGKSDKEFCCVKCAELTVRKVKSIYPGIVMSGSFLADQVSQVSGIQREPDNYDLSENYEDVE